jgi:hypothetical protein
VLETIAQRAAPDAATLETQPAAFDGQDTHATGEAEVTISRASIAIRFRADSPLAVPKAAYGESSGRVTAGRDGWFSAAVNDAGRAANGDRLFGARSIRVGVPAPDAGVAATRLVIAGDAWEGSGGIDGRRVLVTALSSDVVSHHDRRYAVTFEGALDDETIETIGRAGAFVAGIDLEILRVERYDGRGMLIDTEYRRGFRRVGRGTHSPFTGVANEHRMRAWLALVDAFPKLIADGVPIDMIVDQISAHNQVSQIHVSAVLLLLATQTAAYQRLHGANPAAPSASRRAEFEKLNGDLALGLTPEDVARFERLRVELLDSGFFHAPGYETGRPQRDIKFLRDLAHGTVLRLCGYSGPFYGAERFDVRELAASLP